MVIEYWGIYFQPTGYSQHARNTVLELCDLGIDLHLVDASQPFVHSYPERTYFSRERRDKLVTLLTKAPEYPKMRVMCLDPVYAMNCSGTRFYDDVPKVLYSTFEGRRIPTPWEGVVKCFDEVWVTSQYAKDAFKDCNKDIKVIPPGVDKNIYKSEGNSLIHDDRFVFLATGDFLYRKGWDLLIKAYTEEFKDDKDVVLLIKTYSTTLSSEQLKEKIRSMKMSRAPIQIIEGFLDDEKIAELYRSANTFVLPARGEGYCSPAAEALCCGIPVIISEIGGQREFVDQDSAYLIKCDEDRPFPTAEALSYAAVCKGIMFPEPNVDNLKKVMRECKDNPRQLKPAKVLSWRESAEMIAQRIKELVE